MRLNRIKGLLVLLSTIAVLALSANLALAEENKMDFGGSFEVRAISQAKNSDFLFGEPSSTEVVPLGAGLNFRGDLAFTPADQVAAKLRLGYKTDSTMQTDSTTQTGSTLPPAPNVTFTLDRGYIDFTPNSLLSLRVGKQRLAWGTGYAWNPTDLLDLPRTAFTAEDDPEGVVAFRGDLALGPVTGQVFLVPSTDPGSDWEKSGRAVRFKASPSAVDLTAGWVKHGTDPAAVTGDFAYSLSGVGLHGEVLYQSEGNPRADKATKDVINYLVGADYNFPGGYYLAVEYYHNDTAFKDVPELLSYLGQVKDKYIASGNVTGYPAFMQEYLAGLIGNGGATRDHLFVRGSKTFKEKYTAELMAVYNPTDGSVEAQPRLEYAWGQNTTLFVQGLLVNAGKKEAEANLIPLRNRLDVGMKVSF
ncbi:MAG: hypothetical protein M1379_11390 [Firmicutes bacterium]|nr:hypothetical protein [Bacillota bacterium]